jgi:O-antigen/teichoic acid export membrane protein
MPIAFRLLGASQFGVLSIAMLSPALATSLDLGASSAGIRRFATEFEQGENGLGKALGSYALVLIAVGTALGAAIFVLAPHLARWLEFTTVMDVADATELVRLCATWMFLSLALGLPAIVLRARQRFAQLTVIQSLSTLGLWGSVIAVAAMGGGLMLAVALALLTTALNAAACFILARRELQRGTKLSIDFAMIAADSRFSSGLFVAQLSNVVAFQLDRLIIVSLASPAAAGIYALCVAVANKSLFAISALTSFSFPRVAAMRGRDEAAEIGSFLQAVLRVALVLVTPIMVPALVLSGPFLSLWLGNAAGDDAVHLLQLLWIGYGIAAVCAPATHVITGTGTSKLAATFAWVTAILLMLSMLVLVPRFGLVGAGFANVFALSSSFVFVAFVRRQLAAPADPKRRRMYTGLVAGMLAQAGVLAVMAPLARSWGMFFLTGLLTLAVFQLVRWSLRSLTGEEVRLINSLISRLRDSIRAAL